MLYLTGMYALNHTNNQHNGDWHEQALNWDNPEYKDTKS